MEPDGPLGIKDLPETDRPRERLLSLGASNLSDRELLAIIIGGGSRRASALDLAARLLKTWPNFRLLARCGPGDFTRVHGIGPAKAARIQAALAIARRYAGSRLPAGTTITGSSQLAGYMSEKLSGEQREHFYTLLLDTKHRLVREVPVSIGSLSESVVHPREVFRNAIRESAARVVLVHNHPSGNPDPSPEDKSLTRRLVEAGELLGIPVLDHIIVGHDTYFSFAERGIL
jgi:DNA repair protein RadC